MQLMLEGTLYNFIPLREFRAHHNLPPDFGISTFEHKDFTGLGRIDEAGAALKSVRAELLTLLPAKLSPSGWLTFLPRLTHHFQQQLERINIQVGLKDVEIEFAVSGFSDALHQYAFALLRAQSAPLPDFHIVYAEWLNTTARVFTHHTTTIINNQSWNIRVVAHAYGRVGLLIEAGDHIYPVYDPALACPAEGFMTGLLSEIAARMRADAG